MEDPVNRSERIFSALDVAASEDSTGQAGGILILFFAA